MRARGAVRVRRSTRSARFGSTHLSVRSRYPNAAFEWLEAHSQGFGSARGLRATSYFAVREIGTDQVDQGGAGLARVRRGQRVRENARLNLIAPRRIADDPALEAIEHDQNRAQCVVRYIARQSRAPDEAQMQQSAYATSFVVKTQCKGSVQFGDHQYGLGRDLICVRRDYDFREFFYHQVRTLY
jgi:hypothetical protein